MIHPVYSEPSQPFGSNPTSIIHPGSPDYWIIERFGNYQPNGHTGTDYPVKEGTEVRAVTAGQVLHAGTIGGTYADNPWWIAPGFAGVFVVIDHGNFISIYGHLKSGGLKVRAGDWVAEGQVIALSGNTGGSTGDHLHFEVMPDGWDFNNGMFGRVDPARYLPAVNVPFKPAVTATPDEQFFLELSISIP
jgi:murein DD-endopeptidase MepM/ murein hydrolase activator NlpD